MRTFIVIALLLFCNITYAADFAQEFPTGTPLEVVTPSLLNTTANASFLRKDINDSSAVDYNMSGDWQWNASQTDFSNFDSLIFDGSYICMGEISTPPTPPVDTILLYPKEDPDGNTVFYTLDSNSIESLLGSGGGGSGGATTLPGLTDVGNVYYDTGYVLRANGTQYESAFIPHSELTGIGVHNHTFIDSFLDNYNTTDLNDALTAHIANISNPHQVTIAQIGAVGIENNETINGTKYFTVLPQSSVEPMADGDLVNKLYIDSIIQGLIPKDACRVATTENIALNDYPIVDGVELVNNDRVLVKNEVNVVQNGIYIAGEGDWSRATDYDEDKEVKAGTFTIALEGAVNFNKQFIQYEIDPEVDATPINFRSLQTVELYTASNGVQKVVSDFRIDLSDTNPSLEVSDGGLRALVDDQSIERTASGVAVKKADASLMVNASGLSIGLNDSSIGKGTSGIEVRLADISMEKVAGGIEVNPDDSSIETGASGINVKALGVTNAMLAGSIADSKLNTITTTDKVDWAAVSKSGSVLNDIGDVDAPSPSNDQSLTWDAGSNAWVPQTITGGSGGSNNTSGDGPYLPRPDRRKFWLIASSAATYGYVGVATGTTTGTLAAANDATTTYVSHTTAVNATATGGLRSSTYNLVRRQHDPTYMAYIKTGANISNQSIWSGLFSALPTTADNPAGSYFAFRYNDTTSGNWSYVVKDGTTINVTDSGLPVAVNTAYALKFKVDSGNTTCNFTIDGAYEQQKTGNLPAAATELGYANLIFNKVAVAKTLSISRFYCEFTGTGIGYLESAPKDAQYVVITNNDALTAERAVAGTTNQIVITDNGANSNVVFSLPSNVTIDDNITADYFKGNGSLLSGIVIAEADPYFNASAAKNLTTAMMTIWNGTAANNHTAATGTANQVIVTGQALSLPQSINITSNVVFGLINTTDVAYGAGWDGNNTVATKNSLYDKIETLGVGGNPFDQVLNTTSSPTFAGANLSTGGLKTVGSITPAADSTYNSGSSSAYWFGGFIDTLYLNPTATLDGGTAGVVTVVGALTTNSDLGMASTKKIYLDGVARTGDTYLFESAANVFDLYVGTVNTIKSTNSLVTLPSAQVTNYLYGSAAANGDIQIEATSSATKTTANILMNAAGGNVSIGSDASPDYLLDVSGTFGTDSDATIGGEILAGSIHSFTFPLPGALVTGTNMMGTQIIVPFACTLVKAYINAGVAPTGASIIFDANYDSNGGADAGGTSIWASGANRPNIAVSTFTNSTTTFNTTALAAGGTLTMDIDQVGSTIAGSNACLTLICRKTGTY
jgi:hypothetical protein